MLKFVPIALVIFRAVIAPFLLWDAIDGQTTAWFLVGYGIAVLSDIFDGIIARRLKVSTAQLRQADSWADVLFYICVFVSAWLVHKAAILEFKTPLLAIVCLQAIWWIVNLVKYGKPASYHTYSAKLWGISLCVAVIALFGFNYAGLALWSAIAIGMIHTIEEIVMTFILPVWTHDVLSIGHALKLVRNPQMNTD